MFCDHCGHEIKQPWPVEPIFTLDIVAMILCVKPSTLYAVLKKEYGNWPKRYNLVTKDTEGRKGFPYRVRVLTASEVRALRPRFTWTGKREGTTDAKRSVRRGPKEGWTRSRGSDGGDTQDSS